MASRGVNKVILIGRLGGDPEVRYMQSGGAVANITVATSETWRDKATGEQKERTEWHNVALYGKLAEVAGEYLRKGSQVYIEGKLHTQKWQDQSGQDRYTTRVLVQGYNGIMQMLGTKPNPHEGGWGQPQQPAASSSPQRGPSAQRQPQPQNHPPQYNEPPMDFDDDIPFARLGLQYPALMRCC